MVLVRKRLFIFAAATCFALSAFATPAFAEEPSLPDEPTSSSEALVQSDENSDGNSNGNSNENSDGNVKEDAPPSGNDDALSYSDEGQANAGVTTPVVAKIGNTGYTTLQEAINKAKSGDVITLQDDLTLNDEGLRFDGPKVSTPAEWKDITLDAAKHSLTLNDKGIYAAYCKVTITNCPELTVKAGTNPGNTDGETSNISAVLFCPGTLVLNECKTVNITNPVPTTGGSGLCIYNGGNLCIQNNTHFTVSGFMNRTSTSSGQEGQGGCSGIYIDSDPDKNSNYETIMGKIEVSGGSSLTAKNCFHNGITANPIDIIVSDNSELNVNNNNNPDNLEDGKGGLGCYYGTLKVENNSRVVSENNYGAFSLDAHNIDVDGTSEIKSLNNALYGISFDGDVILRSSEDGTRGAQMIADGNYGPGIAPLYKTGTMLVEKGATLSSCHNINRGMANEIKTFTVASGAHVYFKENYFEGLDNYPGATTIVEAGADFVVTGNGGRGIKNGNAKEGSGKLELHSGTITDNNIKGASFTFRNQTVTVKEGYRAKCGGGIYNEYGSISVDSTVNICNNDAVTAGADLYNCNNDGNSFKITVVPGASGNVLKEDGKYIDFWYKDGNGTSRWDEVNAIRYPGGEENMTISIDLGEALKAAHDINAKKYEPPKPSPDPKPEPSPEPKPSPEPSPEPTVTPTPAPSASPAPTAAPTTAPTTAPADNTATAAPATPAPTAQPTVTATPAPTAQASGVIPQTGDSSSPALFSILTLGSITALCVLQKRRKSK